MAAQPGLEERGHAPVGGQDLPVTQRVHLPEVDGLVAVPRVRRVHPVVHDHRHQDGEHAEREQRPVLRPEAAGPRGALGLSLARRASGRIAAALLIDSETRVIYAALENSRLTESAVIKALMHRNAPAALVRAVCDHEKWAPRREVRIALLRNEKTPLSRTLEFSRSLPPELVREILHGSHLPDATKKGLLKDVAERSGNSEESAS